MLKILLLIWIVLYLYLIVSMALKTNKLLFVIDALHDYIKSGTISRTEYNDILKGDSYNEKLSIVLQNYPVIMGYYGLLDGGMGYGQSDFKNYTSACKIYNELLMTKNYYFNAGVSLLNPFVALKKIILFPGYVLRWIGLIKTERAVSFVGLINLIFQTLTIWHEQIKQITELIIKNL